MRKLDAMSFLFLYLYFYFSFSCHFSHPLLNPIFIFLLILQFLFLFQFFIFYVCLCCIIIADWSNVVSIICYNLDSPGIEFWWWREFSTPILTAMVPNQPPVQWVLGLLAGK